MRDSLYLMVQRSLFYSNIYLNFLLFSWSRAPLIRQSSTLLALIQTLMRDVHFQHTTITWWSHELHSQCVMITWHFANHFLDSDAHWSRDLFSQCATVTWHFADHVSDSAFQNPRMALFQAQTETDPKMATQADSLFGPAQTLVSHVVMTTLGCAWLCKAV